MTSTSTASKYIPKRPRICINWYLSFQTQIYLVKIPLNVNIVKQYLLNKKQFLKILWSIVSCLKGGISIDTDSWPLGYVVWCCGSRSQDFFAFIQIGSGSGHTVDTYVRSVTVFLYFSSKISRMKEITKMQKKYCQIVLSLKNSLKNFRFTQFCSLLTVCFDFCVCKFINLSKDLWSKWMEEI